MGSDYNISRRATFQSQNVHYIANYHPDQGEVTFDFSVAQNQILCLSKIEIAFVSGFKNYVPLSPPGDADMAKAILAHIGAPKDGCVLQDSETMRNWMSSHYGTLVAPDVRSFIQTFNPHEAISSKNNNFRLKSGSFFDCFILMYGTLFTSISEIPIHVNECIGFSMCNEKVKGDIVLTEASNDALFQFIADEGGPDFRALPFSMAAINNMPEVLQPVILHKVFSYWQKEQLKALSQERVLELTFDEEKHATDTMLVDAAQCDIDITPKHLKALCQFLVNKGYRKDF